MPGIKRDRLVEKFLLQIRFIERSCQDYDRGVEEDSIRIATHLRTIFHHSPISKSLIKQLKLGGQKMASSSRGYKGVLDYLSWRLKFDSPQPVVTKPILGDKFHEISIADWWDKEIVFAHKTKTYTRKKIILTAANKDGGAHVDELEKFYEALSEGIEMDGITLNTSNLEGVLPFKQNAEHRAKNAHLALIRQFAHEFLASIQHFDWLKVNKKPSAGQSEAV